MDDREWDIFMMEMEARNVALVTEFLVSKMRPRDQQVLVDNMNAQEAQLAPPQELPDGV